MVTPFPPPRLTSLPLPPSSLPHLLTMGHRVVRTEAILWFARHHVKAVCGSRQQPPYHAAPLEHPVTPVVVHLCGFHGRIVVDVLPFFLLLSQLQDESEIGKTRGNRAAQGLWIQQWPAI